MRGARGEDGEVLLGGKGQQGPAGERGLTGGRGVKGLTGQTGDRGTEGLPGLGGDKGESGPPGYSGTAAIENFNMEIARLCPTLCKHVFSL